MDNPVNPSLKRILLLLLTAAALFLTSLPAWAVTNPTVSSASPSAAANTAPVTLTISGDGFVAGASAKLQRTGQPDIVGSPVVVNSSMSITATFNITAAAPGLWTVRVTNLDTGTGTCACFTVTAAAPTVTDVNPSSLPQGTQDADLTVTGTNFAHGAVASFSNPDITVNSTTFVSTTQLTVNIDIAADAASGAGNVTVTNTDGQSGTCNGCFTVTSLPEPVILAANPDDRGAGAQNQDITIVGLNFRQGAVVSFEMGSGITVNSTTFVNATQLIANITISEDSVPGAYDYTVTNVGGKSDTAANGFTVNPGPTITMISPTAASNTGSVHMTITGMNFNNSSVVLEKEGQADIEGTGEVVTPTTIGVDFDLEEAAPGTWTVRVTNPSDAGSGTCACFTIGAAAPTVTGISPASQLRGTSNQNHTVTGTNFAHGAVVSFSPSTGITATTTFVSSTQLTVSVTITAGAAIGPRDVIVTNTDGQSGTCDDCFTVTAPAPTVTSVVPSSRPQGASNENLTVNGTGFLPGPPTTTFSGTGITVNSTTFVSSTQLTVNVSIASNAPTGARNVTATNTDGQSGTCTGCFTVTGVTTPTITSASPAYAARGTSTQNIVLNGSGFNPGIDIDVLGTGVTVNGVDRNSSTRVTINITVASDAATGARSIKATNTDGGTSTCTTCFQVIAFADVPPGAFAFTEIDKIADAGITGGCAINPARYCPNSSISRGQMAVFILRAMDHDGHLPPYRGIFADVPSSHPFARFIEHLYDHGITGGCATNPRRYCPGDPVTREQMAVFLLRAIDHDGHLPPYRGIFADVPSSNPLARFIEHLFDHGVTSGCATNPRRYCPKSSVTRAQMAIFIVRTFGL